MKIFFSFISGLEMNVFGADVQQFIFETFRHVFHLTWLTQYLGQNLDFCLEYDRYSNFCFNLFSFRAKFNEFISN